MTKSKEVYLKLSKIKWKTNKEIEEEKIKEQGERKEREMFKNKNFNNLSRKEKDELLEKIALQLGFL